MSKLLHKQKRVELILILADCLVKVVYLETFLTPDQSGVSSAVLVGAIWNLQKASEAQIEKLYDDFQQARV